MPDKSIRLTPRLCRAARAMLGWRQADLFEASRVPAPTIEAFELKPETARMMGANTRALVAAFEAAGLEFIPENGGGAGIRFRERSPVSAVSSRKPRSPYGSEAEKAAAERAERKAKGEELPEDDAAEAEWQAELAAMAQLTGKTAKRADE